MYGISGTALSWFTSYLTNRTQSVIVDDHASQVCTLSYGVPQGSVFGPILFILYTKPLSDLIKCHCIESQSFVDNTQLQVSVPASNIQSAIFSLETCLSDIQTWMLENKLNNGKTEALLLHSSSKSYSVGKPTTISVCGCEISFSSSARNLGFCLRDVLSRLDCCSSLLSGCSKHLLEKLQTVQNSS